MSCHLGVVCNHAWPRFQYGLAGVADPARALLWLLGHAPCHRLGKGLGNGLHVGVDARDRIDVQVAHAQGRNPNDQAACDVRCDSAQM